MDKLPLISIKLKVDISKLQDLLSCQGWCRQNENDNPVFKKNEEQTLAFNHTRDGYYLRYCLFNEKICNVNLYNSKILDFCKTLLQIENIDVDSIEICASLIPHIKDVSVISLYELNDYLEHCNITDGGTHPNDETRWMGFIQRVKDMNDGEAVKQGLEEVLRLYGWTETCLQKRRERFLQEIAR